jgi:predicted DNA-binding ribbon-helix-helix protein
MSKSHPLGRQNSGKSTLITRNITVCGHRTSMRLEPEMWDALVEICQGKGRTVHEICSDIDRERSESTLTSAMRNFIVNYFRMASVKAPATPPTVAVGKDWMDRADAA